MSSLTAVVALRRYRTWVRRWPGWLALLAPIASWWLDYRGGHNHLLVYLSAIALIGVDPLIDMLYARAVRSRALSVMTYAFNSTAPTGFRVGRSRSFLLFCVVYAAVLTLLPAVAVVKLIEGAADRDELDTTVMAMAAVVCAIFGLLGLLTLRPVITQFTGRPLLTLDSEGIRFEAAAATVGWHEIDRIYCGWPGRGSAPGLALHLTHPAEVMERSRRKGLARLLVAPLPLLDRHGWVFVLESQMREGIAEVMAAAVSLHRVATEH